MNIIFEVKDKTGRIIRLTPKQHTHMLKDHPYMHKYIEEMKETLQNPYRVTSYSLDKDVKYYYKGYKHIERPNKFLLVIVKYLNGEGYVISSYLEKTIK